MNIIRVVRHVKPIVEVYEFVISEKLENFKAAVALNFAYYNFCEIHGAIRCTPAMEAGIEPSQWSVAELVARCGE